MFEKYKTRQGTFSYECFAGIIAALFGVFWTVSASRMGAPFPFPLFGILFIFVALAGVFYNYKNATSRNRMSLFDITDGHEEEDPFHSYIINKEKRGNYDIYKNQAQEDLGYENMQNKDMRCETEEREIVNYCPYCGKKVKKDYMYCSKCGRGINLF